MYLPSDQVPESKSDGSKLTTVTKDSVQVLSVQGLAWCVTLEVLETIEAGW